MTYYTNSNQIKELITSLTNLEVRGLGALESLSDVTVLIFDNLFSFHLPEYPMPPDLLMRLHPDWMGTIFELMRKNRKVSIGVSGVVCCIGRILEISGSCIATTQSCTMIVPA